MGLLNSIRSVEGWERGRTDGGRKKEVKTILLTGPITLYEVSAVRESLSRALAEGKPLRIDLERLGTLGPGWPSAHRLVCENRARRDREARVINVPKL